MRARGLALAVVLEIAMSAGSAAAQTWTPPRTADGQYDLQGLWDFSTITPLERPADLADKPVLTETEARAFEEGDD